ncbi:MAG: ABC transporter ATP-binding protein [Acidobacteria bacterium]|nr:ABC transporter ATP-binding protein [Acidobacteriota bacterium]
MSARPMFAIEAEDLRRVYRRGTEEVAAVDGVSLTVGRGEFLSVVGPSGSGKTTLVNVLGCLDNPTSGRLVLDGRAVFENGRGLSEARLTRVRREVFGYVFQKFYLVPTLTVLENVVLPFTFYRKPGAGGDVEGLLARLGLDKRARHLPGQLSGGEMQRVAIARALVNRPAILLADEPTGNLDTARSEEIGALLKDLNAREGLTVVLVTHNPRLAALADRTVELRDGRVHPA